MKWALFAASGACAVFGVCTENPYTLAYAGVVALLFIGCE